MLSFKEWLKKNESEKTNSRGSNGQSKKVSGNKDGKIIDPKTGSNIKI